MCRLAAILLVASPLVCACKKPSAQVATNGGGEVEVRIGGGGEEDEGPKVGFRIEAAYPAQHPTAAAPWHEAIGEWTFYDAKTLHGVPFGFGLREGTAVDRLSFGEAMLTVPDRAAGEAIVQQFAKAFHGKAPPAKALQPLRFTPFPTAILANGAVRAKGGGFSRGDGSWTATKLFFQRSGPEAEVFFNFDPVSKSGEFTEKDADYADAMVAFLATELRDGPRPRRTPDTDSNLSAVGPKVESWRLIAPPHSDPYGFFTPSRYGFKVHDGGSTRLMSASLDRPTDVAELFWTEHTIGIFRCVDEEQLLCLAEEILSQSKYIVSSNDPRHFILIDRKQKTQAIVTGPWGEHGSMAEAPLSPDGSTIAFTELRRPGDGGKGGHFVAYLVGRVGGAPREIDFGEASANVVGWVGRGEALRAVVRRGDSWGSRARMSFYWVDPRTGARVEKGEPSGIGREENTSPDGRHRVECHGGEQIVVTNLASGSSRAFEVHLDDREALSEDCVSWASSRYLRFDVGKRIGFIDIQTMKLSYMFGEADETGLVELSTDFRWAIRRDGESIQAARIAIR